MACSLDFERRDVKGGEVWKKGKKKNVGNKGRKMLSRKEERCKEERGLDWIKNGVRKTGRK